MWSCLSQADPATWYTRRRHASPEPANRVRRPRSRSPRQRPRSRSPRQRPRSRSTRRQHCKCCRCRGPESSHLDYSLRGRIVRHRDLVVISDSEDDDNFRARSPDVVAFRMPASIFVGMPELPILTRPRMLPISSRRFWEDDSDMTETETADEFEDREKVYADNHDSWKGRVFPPETVRVASEIACGICLEPTAVGKQSVLTACEHSFCLDCLKQWEIAQTHKAHTQHDNSIVFNCPTCRSKI